MTDDELQDRLEKQYVMGQRQAAVEMLYAALKMLGYDGGIGDCEKLMGNLVNEREMAVKTLRSLCEDYGDNDWPANLWLPDVIEKHLGRHLYKNFETHDEGE